MSKPEQKIPVGILGATGSVGQKFIELLANHPWFEIAELCASDKSAGKKYKEAVDWFLPSQLPEKIGEILVQRCEPKLKSKVVFSGLDSNVAGEVETQFAEAGYKVISNSKNHRMDENVPLLIPEVNPEHLELLKLQKYGEGCIVTNPNCSVIGLVLALKPLLDNFGLEEVNVVTMQAVSGAGHPRVVKLDIDDNVIPFISGEEQKVETEPLKILGSLNLNKIVFNDFKISAQCNRVNVTDGHTECVQVKLKKKASAEEIIHVWQNFESVPQKLKLPLAPLKPIHYSKDESFPQPKHQRNADKGMAVSIGRLRADKIFDYNFVILSHNTVRGAAGDAILCAELMRAKGII
ncbi:MAG: aspartate-semialdehyde dehydrogenase [Ignavibacteriaceae bacterium]|nr:aspartate-semialdehyde dehydrogenase [Ignavibacteriaceae bacterium]